MKKKLIALAVAGAMTAPMAAMADVKMSGQLQTQLVSVGGDAAESGTNNNGLHQTDGGTIGNENAGGSWGALVINASEDLGNGMKALAQYGFNISSQDDDGTKAITTRTAYVGIAGDFGAVLAGKMNHPYKTATVSWDPFLSTFMQSRFNGGMGGNQSGTLYGTENNNAFAYAGAFGGAKVVAAMLVDEANDTTGDNDKTVGNHAYAASVNMPVGPVEVAVAYANLSKFGNDGSGASDGDKMTAAKVGVKYAAGDFTVAGQVEMLGEGFAAAGGDKGNVMFLTASYKMGANTISASYGSTDKKLLNADKARTHMAIGLNHALSQKTSAFVGYRVTGNAAVVAGDEKNENVFGGGLRVKF